MFLILDRDLKQSNKKLILKSTILTIPLNYLKTKKKVLGIVFRLILMTNPLFQKQENSIFSLKNTNYTVRPAVYKKVLVLPATIP